MYQQVAIQYLSKCQNISILSDHVDASDVYGHRVRHRGGGGGQSFFHSITLDPVRSVSVMAVCSAPAV